MDNSVKITLIIVSAIIFVGLFGTLVFFYVNPSNTITASGEASVKAMPDVVSVYFNVETKWSTQKEASDKNAEIVDAMTIALIKTELEKKDITTSSYSVNPNYNYPDYQTIKGYTASHYIRIELPTSNSDKIGDIIDAGINSGANLNYINFEISQEKQNEYQKQALILATQDAKSKAEGIVEGAGKNLGRIVSISTPTYGGYYPYRVFGAEGVTVDASQAKVAATTIQPGEQDITGQVQITYTIR